MQLNLTPEQIAAIVQSTRSAGNTDAVVTGIASLQDAGPGDLSFLGNVKYKALVATTRASVVLVPTDYDLPPVAEQCFLYVERPSVGVARLCAHLEAQLWPRPAPGVHPTAWISPQAAVSATAIIGPGCVIEAGAVVADSVWLQAQVFIGASAKIGEGSWLMPGTVVTTHCELGKRVRLQPGVIIGSDGFGYEFNQGRHEKVPQVGNVVIGDDVEIGANTTIDRARFSRTEIGEGTKIDNLVQIGHNVVIGKHCMICAQTGISGSTTLDDYVVLGGQVGVAGHIKIGKGVKVGAQSGIANDTPAGEYINGTPALPYMLERRLIVLQRKLPALFKRVDSVEEILKQFKNGLPPDGNLDTMAQP